MRCLTRMLLCLLAVAATYGLAQAEQIRLTDGRYIQGEVVEVRENGFLFRITETGGRVFLRWGQVDEALKRRLTNDRDPDESLDLEVMVTGARLEMLDGSVHYGAITEVPGGYRVENREFPRGRVIPANEVLPSGFIQDVMIPATTMMTEEEAFERARTVRDPIETAQQYYELARIAGNLRLYERAKDHVSMALSAAPGGRLEARLSEYDAQLDELIRQRGLMTAMVAAGRLAWERKFRLALDMLEQAREEFKPSATVLALWESDYADIDHKFTTYVIAEWYRQVHAVARDKVRERGITVVEAMNWARREMDNEIARRIAGLVGSDDEANIRERFASRIQLEREDRIRLVHHRATFGQDGFYARVGGHLPDAGRRPDQGQGAGDRDRRDRDRGNRDRLPPSGITPGPGGVAPGSGGGIGPGTRSVGPELPDFQSSDVRDDEVRDMIRRMREEREGRDAGREEPPRVGHQDVSHLRVPPTVLPLTEWWNQAGAGARQDWLIAFYVKFSGTMVVTELRDWNIRYK